MGDIEIYESPDGDILLNVQIEDETVWLSLDQMALDSVAEHVESLADSLRNAFPWAPRCPRGQRAPTGIVGYLALRR